MWLTAKNLLNKILLSVLVLLTAIILVGGLTGMIMFNIQWSVQIKNPFPETHKIRAISNHHVLITKTKINQHNT